MRGITIIVDAAIVFVLRIGSLVVCQRELKMIELADPAGRRN